MNKNHAKKVLMLLERLNQEIDLIGSAVLKKNLKAIPVPVKNKRFR